MRRISILTSIALAASASVWILYLLSYRPNLGENNFTRKVIQVQKLGEVRMSVDSQVHVAGILNSGVYLINFSTGDISLTNETFLRTSKVTKIVSRTLPSDSRIFVTGGFIRLVDYRDRRVMSIDLPDGIIDTFQLPFSFIDGCPVDDLRVAVKKPKAFGGEHVVACYNRVHGITREYPDILQKQVDGRFCVDGLLCYDEISGLLAYVYFYRGEFVVMDTTFSVLDRASTIDTVSRAKIAVATFGRDGSITLASPPLVINNTCYFNNGMIYIHSRLKADNETRDDFETNAVIDVYFADGNYRHSFYVEKPGGARLLKFFVSGDLLVAELTDRITSYRLPNNGHPSEGLTIIFTP